jgi:tripartite-type tricarboxylate transporter receptor subunit TctC
MKRWMRIAALAWFALAASLAAAQKFPDRAVTLICPFAPGASADVQLRALAQAMAKELGQPVIVDNRPGAAGTLGAAFVARAKPDGYTLALVTNTVVRQPFISRATYDPVKDLDYVIGVSQFDFGLVVDASSPWKTFQEFTAHAKQHPGRVSYATIGVGSVPHQVMNRIATRLGLEWNHVPYKGSAPALADLQGGHITAVSDATGWAAQVDAGKARLLAVYGDRRLKRYPNTPTLRELGLDIAEASPWGLAAPRGVPAERVRVLHDAAQKALRDPTFLAALEVMANEVRYMDTRQYNAYIAARVPIEKEVVEKYGLRQE